ncbi:hypothetical protein [Rhizobium miluonense]|uniref:hypothetical protein n=1 Tax=Rhizobium miluonense TaxID=411945 RepID=UPI001111977E|nr:hypothetical protein [Rhizobium miluonense]
MSILLSRFVQIVQCTFMVCGLAFDFLFAGGLADCVLSVLLDALSYLGKVLSFDPQQSRSELLHEREGDEDTPHGEKLSAHLAHRDA